MLAHALKYSTIARLTVSDILEYRLDNLFRIGRYAFMVSFMLFLWLAIAEESAISSFNIPELIQYYILAIIIYGVSNYHLDYIETDIRLGYASKYLLKPISAFWHYCIHQATINGYDVLVKLFLFAPLFFIMDISLSLHFSTILLATLLLIAGFFTTFSLYFSFSIMAFWFAQVDSLRMTALFLGRYLSGVLIPFYLFPQEVQNFLWWSPFPHYAYTPIALLNGSISVIQGLQGLCILSIWGIIFFVISTYIWNQATHVYESTGL